MGNQRAIDQFNFVVDNGGGEPAPTVPSNLQSPASVLSGPGGSTSLSLNSNNSSSTVTISASGGPGQGDAALIIGGNSTSTLVVGNTQLFTTATDANPETILRIQNSDSPPINTYASFDTGANITDLGNPLLAGAIYLNNTTTVTSSASRPPAGGLLLQQLTASSSSIGQQVASQGVLVLGSSTAHATTLVVSDIPYLGASNFVEIYGGAGLAPLFLTGAQGSANQCGIHPDIGTGGQLLLGSSNNFATQIQITDATVQYNVAPTVNTSLMSTSTRIPATGTMVTNTDYLITNPTNVGLYAIVVNVDNTAAGTNNAQASSIGYWNGTVWDYGGTARSCPFGNGELIIGFGLTTPYNVRAALTATFTGNTQNPAVYIKFIPLYGNMGL